VGLKIGRDSCLNSIIVDVKKSQKKQDHCLIEVVDGFDQPKLNKTQMQSNPLLSLLLVIKMGFIESIERKQETYLDFIRFFIQVMVVEDLNLSSLQ
jgi:hypothetical protein